MFNPVSSLPVVQGWVRLAPGWQSRYTLGDFDTALLPDNDPAVLTALLERKSAEEGADATSLSGYYDEVLRVADLEAFDPATRRVQGGACAALASSPAS